MKNLFVFCIAFMAFLGFYGCSSDGADEIIVSVVDKVECPGDLKPYLHLSKGDYTLKKLKSYKSLGGDKLSHMQLTISFESIKAVEITDDIKLILSIVDENYNQVNNKATFTIDMWSKKVQETIISSLKSGEGRFSISISTEDAGVGDPIDADEWSEIKNKAKYVVVSSSKAKLTENQEDLNYYEKLFEDNLHNDGEADSDGMTSHEQGDYEDYDANNQSSGSTSWNELLDSYEKYVDKYIAFMKRANNGDMSAMSEYPKFLQSAQDLSEKLQNAQGDMSPSQWSKYMKIQQKMINAAQKMQ